MNRGSNCPRCPGSLTTVSVYEHRACAHIAPVDAFTTPDGVACPDCGVTDPDDFERVAAMRRCDDCGCRVPADTGRPRRERPEADAGALTTDGSGGSGLLGERVAKALFVVALLVVASVGAAALTVPLQPRPDHEWRSYESVVVFRNDDIQPHYRTETMRAVDQMFVEAGVPVTLGVIPATADTPLDPDGRLCGYLRGLGSSHRETFEFAVHGYNHARETGFHGGSEFGGLPAAEQRRRVDRATAVFEACVGRSPRTFVPPMDTYDDATVAALADRGYAVVSGGGWFTDEFYDETGLFRRGGLLHAPNDQSFVENWTTNEFHDQRDLEAAFDSAHRNNSVYVQMLHYPQFDSPEHRDRLRALIEHMQSHDGVAFTTLGRLSQRFSDDTIRRTDGGWELYERTGGGRDWPRLADLDLGWLPAAAVVRRRRGA